MIRLTTTTPISEDLMSIPAPPRSAPHHAYRSWSSFWREDGKKQCKRFGRVGQVTKAAATARYTAWFNGEYAARQEAQRRAAAEGEPGAAVVVAGAFTVNKLCRLYAAEAQTLYTKNGKLTSHIDQVEAALQAMMDAYGDRPADLVGAPEVAALLDKMIDTTDRHGNPRVLSTWTINGRLRIVKQAYAWARQKGMVGRIAAADISLVKPLRPGRCRAKAPREVLPVPDGILQETLAHCPRTVADMIRVQLLTGMRPGELCNMRPCDIDPSDATCWTYRPSTHKTEHKGKVRLVPIGARAQEILRPYIDRREFIDYVFLAEEAHKERLEQIGFAAVTAFQMSRSRFKPKRRFDRDSYRNKIGYACDRAFDPAGERRKARDFSHRWHPHRLRHNYATAIRAEFGLEAAADMLGHANVSTAKIYAERSHARAKDVARKVG